MAIKEDLQALSEKNEALEKELAALKTQKAAVVLADGNTPMTNAEIKELTAMGYVIGNRTRRPIEGHDEKDLARWDEWHMELRLKNITRDGKTVSMPYEAYAVKKLKVNIVSPADVIVKLNNIRDYRLNAAPNYHMYYFPQNTIEAGKTYPCTTYFETVGKGVNETVKENIVFVGIEAATKCEKV
jgi:hypothetical protein